MKVFVSGSRRFRELPEAAKASLAKIIELGFVVLVGDCYTCPPGYGVDTLVQDYLAEKDYRRVVVFHIGEKPRHNHGFDAVRVGASKQNDKDAAI